MKKMSKKKEKYEILMGQLILIILVALLATLSAGYFLGKEVGFSKGTSTTSIVTPEYCTVDRSADKIHIDCSELEDITLDDLCGYMSPALKEKIRIVMIT